MLTLDELRADDGLDTVVVAFTDMQGRLLGKRLHKDFFLEDGIEHVEGCNYLLALEMEMDPVPGYEIASWERGYGDFVLRPDLATLRRIPWVEGNALVLCDVGWEDGSPVAPSPRQVLRSQLERLEAHGLEARFGTELEFFLLKESYADAHAAHYRGLTPSVPYILDYHVLASTYDEPLLRRIRNDMQAAGLRVESSKGEAWPGQHEINFHFADALTTADNHTVYKNGAKEIAHLEGCSITFMAKPDHTWIGNSCHVHGSLWRDGEAAFTDDGLFGAFLAGWIAVRAGARGLPRAERQLVQALRRGLVGADDARVGERQPHVRLPRRRARPLATCRDADPRRRRQPVPRVRGARRGRPGRHRKRPRAAAPRSRATRTSRTPSASRRTLREAIAALEQGTMARAAFGDHVVDHYLNYARTEQRLFDEVVTCYERERLFERA